MILTSCDNTLFTILYKQLVSIHIDRLFLINVNLYKRLMMINMTVSTSFHASYFAAWSWLLMTSLCCKRLSPKVLGCNPIQPNLGYSQFQISHSRWHSAGACYCGCSLSFARCKLPLGNSLLPNLLVLFLLQLVCAFCLLNFADCWQVLADLERAVALEWGRQQTSESLSRQLLLSISYFHCHFLLSDVICQISDYWLSKFHITPYYFWFSN